MELYKSKNRSQISVVCNSGHHSQVNETALERIWWQIDQAAFVSFRSIKAEERINRCVIS